MADSAAGVAAGEGLAAAEADPTGTPLGDQDVAQAMGGRGFTETDVATGADVGPDFARGADGTVTRVGGGTDSGPDFARGQDASVTGTPSAAGPDFARGSAVESEPGRGESTPGPRGAARHRPRPATPLAGQRRADRHAGRGRDRRGRRRGPHRAGGPATAGRGRGRHPLDAGPAHRPGGGPVHSSSSAASWPGPESRVRRISSPKTAVGSRTMTQTIGANRASAVPS